MTIKYSMMEQTNSAIDPDAVRVTDPFTREKVWVCRRTGRYLRWYNPGASMSIHGLISVLIGVISFGIVDRVFGDTQERVG